MSLKNGQLDEFVESTVRETSRLSAEVDNISEQLTQHKHDTNIRYDRIDNKLDDIKHIVSEGFNAVEKKELEHGMRIKALEDTNKAESDYKVQSSGWKFLLYSAAISPIVGVILELIIHAFFHK